MLMETLIHLPTLHPDAYSITFMVLGFLLGKYKLILIPLRLIMEKLDKDEADKHVATCAGKGE
jgi:hypothetical protein